MDKILSEGALREKFFSNFETEELEQLTQSSKNINEILSPRLMKRRLEKVQPWYIYSSQEEGGKSLKEVHNEVFTKRTVLYKGKKSEEGSTEEKLEEEEDTSAVNKVLPLKRKNPLHLPDRFSWVIFDEEMSEKEFSQEFKLTSGEPTKNQLKIVYDLLKRNYSEDGNYRVRFSIDYIDWILRLPNSHCIGVCCDQMKQEGSKEEDDQRKILVAFVCASLIHVRNCDKLKPVYFIHHLCVHKKLRQMRLASLLMKEMSRYLFEKNQRIASGVFSLGIDKSNLGVCNSKIKRCFFPLNIEKLIDLNFFSDDQEDSIALEKAKKTMTGFKDLKVLKDFSGKYVEKALKFVNEELSVYKLAQCWSIYEFSRWFLPHKSGLKTFIITDDKDDVVSFASFYLIEVYIGSTKLVTGSLIYLLNKSKEHSKNDIMVGVISKAKDMGCELFEAQEVMDNKEVLDNLNFTKDPGNTFCYQFFFNVGDKKLLPTNENALVLPIY